MFIFKNTIDLKNYLNKIHNSKMQIGFVPTMGALHEGHLSLIEASKKNHEVTIASIFVNPTQFNNKEDFAKYPITLDADIEKLTASGCDALFLPSVSDLYTNGTNNLEHYDLGNVENILEGAHRPGHFQGVCQVLSRFLKIIQPNRMYMGQKDFQQVAVVSRLIKLMNIDTEIVPVSIKRDQNGLALSSRNMRLSVDQLPIAKELYNTLCKIKVGYQENTTYQSIKNQEVNRLATIGFKTDYIALADINLNILDEFVSSTPMVALIASTIGDIRLIDNLLIN